MRTIVPIALLLVLVLLLLLLLLLFAVVPEGLLLLLPGLLPRLDDDRGLLPLLCPLVLTLAGDAEAGEEDAGGETEAEEARGRRVDEAGGGVDDRSLSAARSRSRYDRAGLGL